MLFGLGGADGDGLADRAARLAPLTDTDADDLIRSARAAPRLLGRRGAPAADLAALRDMLLRVSRMADDLPQIAELELSPVIARPDGVHAVDGRIRIRAAEPADAHLRRLHDRPVSGARASPQATIGGPRPLAEMDRTRALAAPQAGVEPFTPIHAQTKA